jgi:pimeloyl-ACP methyl ester carboxylesterase
MTASVAPIRLDKRTTVRSVKPPPITLRMVKRAMAVLASVSPEGAAALAERMFLSPRRHPRPAAETELLARARPRSLSTRYGALAGWEWAPEAGAVGPRVLLVHGWEGRGAQLGAFVHPLVALDFRVVTFDAPAHGASPGARASLFHFADAVERAADQWGPFHAIVAHSMGGASTLWASRHSSLASRLVMIAPPVDLRDFTRSMATTLGLPEEVRGRVHRRLGKRFGIPIEEARAERLASSMRGPLLLVHDEDDHDVPIACGEAIARAWPGSEFVRTRGLGHRRILHDPKTLETIVRFVANGSA